MEVEKRRKQLTYFYRRHYLNPLVESYGMGYLASETKALQIETANNNCDVSFKKSSKKECPICYEALIGHIAKLKCDCHFTCHHSCWMKLNSGKSKEFKCPQCRKDMTLREDIPPLKKYLEFDIEKAIPQVLPEQDFIKCMERNDSEEVRQEWIKASKKITEDEGLQEPFTTIIWKLKMGLRFAKNNHQPSDSDEEIE